MRIFRYLLPILLIAVVWYVIKEFVVKEPRNGDQSLKERLWESAQHFHWSVGVVAALIVIAMIVRFLLQVFKFF